LLPAQGGQVAEVYPDVLKGEAKWLFGFPLSRLKRRA